MWAILAQALPFVMAIVRLFVSGKERQNQIEQNMREWFKKKTSEGEDLSDQKSEFDKQAEELAALRTEEKKNV